MYPKSSQYEDDNFWEANCIFIFISVEHEIHIEMKAQNWHILTLSKKMMISILSAYNFLTKHLRKTCIKYYLFQSLSIFFPHVPFFKYEQHVRKMEANAETKSMFCRYCFVLSSCNYWHIKCYICPYIFSFIHIIGVPTCSTAI